jgi:hypothetical protein
MLQEKIYFNGIDAVTGEYMIAPMDYNSAVNLIIKGEPDKRIQSWFARIWRSISDAHLGLPFDTNPELVEQAGWAIVFHENEDTTVKQALEPLIAHRRKQIKNDSIVKVFQYSDGDDGASWLARHGIGPGSIYPDKVPYYLLFVGSPGLIPFVFCHHLGVEYAVGRLHFDTANEYSKYVDSVIAYETGKNLPNARDAVFFASRHHFDQATQMSADLLMVPLAEGGSSSSYPKGIARRWGFRQQKKIADEAQKSALSEIFDPPASVQPPALLFTATHGMGWPKGHCEQLACQGALLCQDWPGFGNISPAHYFGAADVPDSARVHGMVAFFFACYGAGTPRYDRFLHTPGSPAPEIADEPFFASLPKRLMSHPNGGALACIGHVERAWGYSIVTPNAGAQLLPFENALGRIMVGQPVGHAMRDFNERYASLSTALATMLEEMNYGRPVSTFELASAWIGRNDAEGYVVLGDPAIKLRVNDLAPSV